MNILWFDHLSSRIASRLSLYLSPHLNITPLREKRRHHGEPGGAKTPGTPRGVKRGTRTSLLASIWAFLPAAGKSQHLLSTFPHARASYSDFWFLSYFSPRYYASVFYLSLLPPSFLDLADAGVMDGTAPAKLDEQTAR